MKKKKLRSYHLFGLYNGEALVPQIIALLRFKGILVGERDKDTLFAGTQVSTYTITHS